MSPFLPAVIGDGEFISSIVLPNEVVCWVGSSLKQADLMLATESGLIVGTDLAGTEKFKIVHLGLEDEAINGLAFYERYIAVSTRAAVQLITLPENADESLMVAELPFGAHGVAVGKAGRFFAPVGMNGVMTVLPVEGMQQRASTSKLSGEELYIYKLTTLDSKEGDDVIACAARTGGIVSYVYSENSPSQQVGILEMGGLDIIDICPIANPGGTPMAAAVSRDGAIILLRDVLSDNRPLTVRFDSIVGTAYRILVCRDYTFLMTGKAVYVIAGLIEHLRTGKTPITQVMKIPVKGIDMNICDDRWLFMILADQVLKLDVEQLKHTPTAMMNSWAVHDTKPHVDESLRKTRRLEAVAESVPSLSV